MSFTLTNISLGRFLTAPKDEVSLSDEMLILTGNLKRITLISEDLTYFKEIFVSFNGEEFRKHEFKDVNVEIEKIIEESQFVKPWERDNLRPIIQYIDVAPSGVCKDLWLFDDSKSAVPAAKIAGAKLNGALAVKIEEYYLDNFDLSIDMPTLESMTPNRKLFALHLPLSDAFLENIYQDSLEYAVTYKVASQFLNRLLEFKSIELPKLKLFWISSLELLPKTCYIDDYIGAARFASKYLQDMKIEQEILDLLCLRVSDRSIFSEKEFFPEVCQEANIYVNLADYYRSKQFSDDHFTEFSKNCNKALATCLQDPSETIQQLIDLTELLTSQNMYWEDWSAVNLNQFFTDLLSNFIADISDKKLKAKISGKLKYTLDFAARNVDQYGRPQVSS
jgi:hypothetical protein